MEGVPMIQTDQVIEEKQNDGTMEDVKYEPEKESKNEENLETAMSPSSRKRHRLSIDDQNQEKRSILRPRLSNVAHIHSLEDLEPDPLSDSYPARAPRVNADNYQASLPELRDKLPDPQQREPVFVEEYDRCLRLGQIYIDQKRIWNGRNSSKIDDYLVFCRILLHQPAGILIRKDGNWIELDSECINLVEGKFKLSPSESDEAALTFLAQCDYNIDKAKLLLVSNAGAGCDEASAFARQRNGQSSFTDPNVKRSSSRDATSNLVDSASRTGGPQWKQWLQAAKDCLSSKKMTRESMLDLIFQMRALPKSGADPKTLSDSNDLVQKFETKINQVDLWIASVHDCLSMTKPDMKWSLSDVKDLLDSVPKDCALREFDLIKDIYTQSVKLQKETLESLSSRVDLKVLDHLQERIESQPLDLGCRDKVRSKIESVHAEGVRIKRIIPMSMQWEKIPEIRREWKMQNLEQLESALDESNKLDVDFRELGMLSTIIQECKDWKTDLAQVLEENASVKKLLEMLKWCDALPVDLHEDRAVLQEALQRKQEIIMKVNSVAPKLGKSSGRSKSEKRGGKVEIDTLRELRDEAESIGMTAAKVEEINAVIAKVDEWLHRVRQSLVDIDTVLLTDLEMMLSEVQAMPVLVPEEELVSACIDSKNLCDEIESALASQQPLSDLVEMVNQMTSIRTILSKEKKFQVGASSKRNEIDARLKSIVSECQNWVGRVEFLCGAEATEDKGASSKKKGRKKSKRNATPKKKLNENLFTVGDRISTEKLVDIFKEGLQFPVNVYKELQMLLGLESQLDAVRQRVADVLERARQTELLATLKDQEKVPLQSLLSDVQRSNIAALDEGDEPMDEAMTKDETPTEDDIKVEGPDGSTMEMEVDTTATQDTKRRRETLSLDDLVQLKDQCCSLSIISPEEQLLDKALETAKAWIARALVFCPNLEDWEEFATDSSESEENQSVITIHEVENILENASKGLILDVDTIVEHLREVIDAATRWSERCIVINNDISAIVRNKAENEKYFELFGELANATDDIASNDGEEVDFEMTTETLPSETRQTKRSTVANNGVATTGITKDCDTSLGLVPTNQVKAFWQKLALNLEVETNEKYPIQDEASTPCSYFKVSVERYVPDPQKLPALHDDILEIAQKAVDIASEIVHSQLSGIALRLAEVQETMLLAEWGLLIQEIRRCASQERTSNACELDHVRELKILCKLVLDGKTEELETLNEEFGTDLEISKDDKPTNARATLQGLMEHCWLDLQGATEEDDILKSNLRKVLCAYSNFLSFVGQHVVCWNMLAQKCFNNLKTLSSLLVAKTLVDRKLALDIFPSVPVETLIIDEISATSSWIQNIQGMKRYPEPDTLDELIASGNKLKVNNFVELTQLKNAAKEARNWLSRVRKTGIERGEAVLDELRELIDQGKCIPVDLDKDMEILLSATRQYCICRSGFQDYMLACCVCKEWYHTKCIGVSLTNARRMTRWTCDRCNCDRISNCELGLAKASVARLNVMSLKYPNHETMTLEKFTKFRTWANRCAALFSKQVVDKEFENAVLALAEPQFDNFIKMADGAHIYNALSSRIWANFIKEKVFTDEELTVEKLDKAMQVAQRFKVGRIPEVTTFVASLEQRAKAWTSQANIVLAHPRTVSKEKTVSDCRALLESAETIPVFLEKLKQIESCYEDQASRYCLCDGFTAAFMIECDKCEIWMHGSCVNVSESQGSSLSSYTCPRCCRNEGIEYAFGITPRTAMLLAQLDSQNKSQTSVTNLASS